jgi:type I restriction enzyme R subunit
MERPEISILSDEFLDGLRLTDKPNLQLALLRRLLDDRLRTMRRQKVLESRRLSETLEEAIRRYLNRALTTAEIIAELVVLAKEMRESEHRGEALGLRRDEVAFYDAIRQNDAAVLQLGDETLKAIAQQLVTASGSPRASTGRQGNGPRSDPC